MFKLTNRLLSDKEIGRRIVGSRFYSVKSSEWDEYNNYISNKYSRDYTNNNNTKFTVNTALTDTVVSHINKITELNNSYFRHSEQIRDLKINVGGLTEGYLHIKEDLYNLKKHNEFESLQIIRQLEDYSQRLTKICEKMDKLIKK